VKVLGPKSACRGVEKSNIKLTLWEIKLSLAGEQIEGRVINQDGQSKDGGGVSSIYDPKVELAGEETLVQEGPLGLGKKGERGGDCLAETGGWRQENLGKGKHAKLRHVTAACLVPR